MIENLTNVAMGFGVGLLYPAFLVFTDSGVFPFGFVGAFIALLAPLIFGLTNVY